MNIHTVATEVPDNIKPTVANEEAFGEAIKARAKGR